MLITGRHNLRVNLQDGINRIFQWWMYQ